MFRIHDYSDFANGSSHADTEIVLDLVALFALGIADLLKVIGITALEDSQLEALRPLSDYQMSVFAIELF